MQTSIEIMGETAVTFSTAETTNAVKKVSYRICATEGTRFAHHYDVAVFEAPSPGSFTPYEDLTLEQVTAWIADTVSADVYTALEAKLAEPMEEDTTLPWKKISEDYADVEAI